MNINKLMEILLLETECKAEPFYKSIELGYQEVNSQIRAKRDRLRAHLDYLSKEWNYIGGEELLNLLFQKSKDEVELKKLLTEAFPNDISKISFCLNYFHPQKYVYYNSNSEIEGEIFKGIAFLANEIPDFRFSFDRIGSGRDSFANYESFNRAMTTFRDSKFSKDSIELRNYKYLYFLYQSLGSLFIPKDDYKRYWFFATKDEKDFVEKNTNDTWPARKDMKKGELAFFYRMGGTNSGLSNVTDILELTSDAYINPFDYYFSYRVAFKQIADIDISLKKMKSIWPRLGTVQGITVINMPGSVFNRALPFIARKTTEKLSLSLADEKPIGIQKVKIEDEADFEKKIVEPFITGLNLVPVAKPCKKIQIGSDNTKSDIIPDYIIKHKNKVVAVLENKKSIGNDRELERAYLQGNTYALLFGLKVFVIMSVEGVKVYKTNISYDYADDHRKKAEWECTWDKLQNNLMMTESFREMILYLSQ